MENNTRIKIDLDSIEEFPPSFLKTPLEAEKSNNILSLTNTTNISKSNDYNNNNTIHSRFIINNSKAIPEEIDEFEEFAENFNKNASLNNKENNSSNTPSLKEIRIENSKQLSFRFNEKDFVFIFLSYSNLNFFLISENKKE